MPDIVESQLKVLTLLKILREKTDALCMLSMSEIITEMEMADRSVERKGVGRMIETMRAAGFDIEYRKDEKTGKWGYALKTRDFSFQEMIWLVDAVQSCPSLTVELSDKLIKRIQDLASESERKKLVRNVDVPNRAKMLNEDVLVNLDVLQQCKRLHKVANFQYFDYDTSGKPRLKYNGFVYELTVVSLTYSGKFYYLVGWDAKHERFTTYRVDRMTNVRVGEESEARNRQIATYDPDEMEPVEFDMYGLNPTGVKLLVDAGVVSMVKDRFGNSARYYPAQDKKKCRVHAKAVAGPAFYSWLAKFGNRIKVEWPSDMVEGYRQYLHECLENYE